MAPMESIFASRNDEHALLCKVPANLRPSEIQRKWSTHRTLRGETRHLKWFFPFRVMLSINPPGTLQHTGPLLSKRASRVMGAVGSGLPPAYASLAPANDRPYTDLLNSTVGPPQGAVCRVFLSL